MKQSTPATGRKKFLLWGITLLSSFTVFKFIAGNSKKNNAPAEETVKMLTPDGKLVAIDKKLLKGTGNKISNQELQNWIKK